MIWPGIAWPFFLWGLKKMFEMEKFKQAEIKQRTKDVPVPLLQDFFSDGDEAVWKVRALTSEDVAKMNEAQQRNKAVESLIGAAVSASMADKAEAIKSMMGLGDELPDDTTRRIEALILASVAPECDRETAVKISVYYPTVFSKLTDEIFLLSGQGGEVVGKPANSTKKMKSKSP